VLLGSGYGLAGKAWSVATRERGERRFILRNYDAGAKNHPPRLSSGGVWPVVALYAGASFRQSGLSSAAHIWDHWSGLDGGDDLPNATIIVGEANNWMRRFHDRMPIILDGATRARG
jgi:hypothetical protein